MRAIALKPESNFLPILLVIKVYTGFLMTNSLYSMGALNVLLVFIIWIAFFLCNVINSQNRIKEISLSFSIVCIFFVAVYLFDTDYSNKQILYDLSLVYIFAALPIQDRLKTFNYFVNFGAILLVFSIIEFILYFGFGKGFILATFDRGENEKEEMWVTRFV